MSFPSSSFGSQLAAIMDVLAKNAVAEITKLVEDGSVSLRLEVCRRDAEILELRRSLELMEAELYKAQEAVSIRETEERQEEQPAAESQVLRRDKQKDQETSAAYPESKTADSLREAPNETDENIRPAVKHEPVDELITTGTTDNTVSADVCFEAGRPDDSMWPLPACSAFEKSSTQQQIQAFPSHVDQYSESLFNSLSAATEEIADNCLNVPIKVEMEVRPMCMENTTSQSVHNQQFGHVLRSVASQQAGSSLAPPAQRSTGSMLASNPEDHNIHSRNSMRARRQTNVWRSNQRLFICSVCNKGFPRLSQLEEHRSTHQPVKPFRCLKCGKSFTQKTRLKTHQSVHTGERPYSCKICGKMFSRQDNCLRHERFHSGLKPYSCRQCGKSFTVLGNLKIHQEIHLQGR